MQDHQIRLTNYSVHCHLLKGLPINTSHALDYPARLWTLKTMDADQKYDWVPDPGSVSYRGCESVLKVHQNPPWNQTSDECLYNLKYHNQSRPWVMGK